MRRLGIANVETNVDLVVDLHECEVAGGSGPGLTIRALPIVSVPRDSWMWPQRTRSGCSRSTNARTTVLPTCSPLESRSQGVPLGWACGQKIVSRDRCDAC